MRVILCTEFYHDCGGAYAAALDAERLLQSRGHQVFPFASRHPDGLPAATWRYFPRYEDLRALLVSRRPGTLARAAWRALWSFEAAAGLRRMIWDYRPDVVHVHNYAYHLTPAIFEAVREEGVPLVHTLHDYKLLCPQLSMVRQGTVCRRCRRRRFYNCVRYRCVENSLAASALAAAQNTAIALTGAVVRATSAYISPSEFLKARLFDWGGPAARATVVPNFVWPAPDFIAPPTDAPLLFAGRLTGEKGLGTLLQAMRRVPEARLVVAGDGPVRKRLQAEAPPNVAFLGAVPRGQMPALYRRSLCVIVPSEWYENCSLTVLEAFANGRAVIASQIGGLPEQVIDGVTGLLFDSGNVAALCECIGEVVQHRPFAEQWGKEAQRRARTVYSPEVHYSRLKRIYDSL